MDQLKKILLSLIASLTMLLTGHGASSTPPPATVAPAANVTTNSELNTPTYIPIQIQGGQPTESACPQEGHIKSPSSFDKATVTFDNQTAGDLKVYWIDFQGNRKFYSNLKAHTKYNQSTWIGHVWVVTDAGDKCVKLESANAVSQELVIN